MTAGSNGSFIGWNNLQTDCKGFVFLGVRDSKSP